MALKEIRGNDIWIELCKFYVITITSGLLYMRLFATGEPVCYSRNALDDRNRHIFVTYCSSNDRICKRFASRKEVNWVDILNSPCNDPEDFSSSPELSSQRSGIEAITCSTTNLPTITDGSFDCPLNSNVSKGFVCTLTCKDGFYPATSNQTVCEEGTTDQGGKWSDENFTCLDCYLDEWNGWGGNEYKFTSTRKGWLPSRDLCKSDGAHLVTIESEEENDFLSKVVKHCIRWETWIGLNDVKGKGVWKWSNNTDPGYRNWKTPLPLPLTVTFGKCAGIYKSSGEWGRFYCTNPYPAICERKKPLT